MIYLSFIVFLISVGALLFICWTGRWYDHRHIFVLVMLVSGFFACITVDEVWK